MKTLYKYLAPANFLLFKKKKKWKNAGSNTILCKQKWHIFAICRPTYSDIESCGQPGQESGERSRTCYNSLDEQGWVMAALASLSMLPDRGEDLTLAKAENYSVL